jgi:integral membrane protein
MSESSFKTPVGRLLKIGFWEGISYLILLIIAMPLKYWAGMPQPVRIVGMAHGILFVAYIVALLHATIFYKWSIKTFLIGFFLSFLPFGTFFLEKVINWEKK